MGYQDLLSRDFIVENVRYAGYLRLLVTIATDSVNVKIGPGRLRNI